MNLNKYFTYSAVTTNVKKEEEDNTRIFDLIDEFKNIRSIKRAKEFVKQNWNITDDITNFPVGNDCILSTKESDNGYCVNFVFGDENVMYFFKKQ